MCEFIRVYHMHVCVGVSKGKIFSWGEYVCWYSTVNMHIVIELTTDILAWYQFFFFFFFFFKRHGFSDRLYPCMCTPSVSSDSCPPYHKKQPHFN